MKKLSTWSDKTLHEKLEVIKTYLRKLKDKPMPLYSRAYVVGRMDGVQIALDALNSLEEEEKCEAATSPTKP